MSVRLRDEAVILEPQRIPDPNTAKPVVTWSADHPPTEHPVRFEGQVASAGGGDVDEGTTVELYRGYLDAADDDKLTTACRIRWHGDDYVVDGPIARHRRNGRVRFLSFTVKPARAKGGA